jgi:uncharacterized membrane protein
MTTIPSYVVHHVDENDVTIDWFFGPGHSGKKVTQLVLILIGWFFAVLPVMITASALLHRGDEGGWWGYHEGLVMWDRTMAFLGILTVFFAVAFLVLHLVNRAAVRRGNQSNTYDERRLDQRLELAATWYDQKYGPEALRRQQKNVQVEPYGDLETYELRGRYRSYGVY